MDDGRTRRMQQGYQPPRIADYGTLTELTADAAPLMMRQLGMSGGGAMFLATAPAAPGEGGGGGSAAGPGGVAGDAGGGVLAATEGPAAAGDGGDAAGDGGEAPAGDGGVQGETAERSGEAGATGTVAGEDELPFTGLDVTAAAAAGAISTAAGVALRRALPEEQH